MEATIKTVKNYLSLTIIIRGEKFTCASREALVETMVRSYKDSVKKASQGGRWFDKITRGDGVEINPQDVYWEARERLAKEKKKYKKPAKKIKNGTYGRERGYLFNMKDRDTLDEDEPKGKKVVERGFYFYEYPWYRRTKRNWKSFRKTQYK